jgi:hypothetical protein
MITLGHYTNPLHGEILNGEKQRAQVASLDFHIV